MLHDDLSNPHMLYLNSFLNCDVYKFTANTEFETLKPGDLLYYYGEHGDGKDIEDRNYARNLDPPEYPNGFDEGIMSWAAKPREGLRVAFLYHSRRYNLETPCDNWYEELID